MKRIFIFILISAVSAQTCSQKNRIQDAINNLKNDIAFKNASIGFYVQDVYSGTTVASLNANLSLAPASTQKIVSTATAMEVFGNKHRFKTRLEYTGHIDTATGILDGNIIIKGGGDPTLGSKYFDQTNFDTLLNNWELAIHKAGIKFINGHIIGDASIFNYQTLPPKWTWEDIGNYFGAGANGLSIHDNLYSLFFNTSSKKGGKTKIVSISPEIKGLELDNHVISDAVHSDLSYIFGAPYTYKRYITGRLPLNRKNYEVKGSLPDPALFAAQSLKKILKKNNIASGSASTFRLAPELKKIDTLQHQLLYTAYSPELSEIIKLTNFKSINLFAEHLYKQVQLKFAGYNKNKINNHFIENFWQKKGADTKGMFIFDGSGLARYNGISAKQIVFILRYMQTKSKYADYFYNSLPQAGKEGTVKRMCKNTSAQKVVRMKSGSLKNVRAYAGYVRTKSGRLLAFSIMANNFNCSSSEARKKIEKVICAISDYNK